MNRHDLAEEPTTCMIRIKRGNNWYQMRPLPTDGCFVTVAYSKKIIERLRRKGREVNVVWLTGMGLGLE